MYKRQAWVAVGLWGLAGLLLASTEIVDPDFAFHVGWGRVLLTDFPGASHVTLGQSSAVQSYAYSYWLYQVAVSLVFGSGGAGAVVLLRALLLAAAFFLAVRIALRQGVPVVSIPILLAFALVTAQERFLDRPELVSYVLWVAALGVLMRPGSRDRRALRLLVPILVLWTNTHLSFPLMLGMVGLFAIGERLEGQPLRPRAIQIAVLLLASFLNPAGPLVWRSLEQIVPFFGRGQGLPFRIEEMTSPFGSYQESPAVWAFRIGMPLLVAAALLARRRMPAGALLVLLASALLAARARRAMPLFALTTLCVTPAALRALFEGTRDRERRPATKIARAIGIALVAVPLFAGVVTVLGLANGRIFLALDQDRSIAFRMSPRFPALEAARFLRDQGVQGPVFHNAVAAPAILLENGTRLTPFLDARWRGTPEAVAIYQSIRTAGDAAIAERWKQAMEARGFEAVLLDFYEMPALLRLLDEDPRWAFVHVDETAAVFVRRQGANAAIARRLENAEPLRAGRDPVREQALADAI
ncbi:MAG: hypothetical protein QUU85_13515, partial [Candidatus Eisenbacteria bacterium]|nr:hypothetical protein [Candidatus Eisenbacteria bacterium]